MGAAALTESGEPPAPNANPPRRFSAVRWPGSLLQRGVELVLW